MYKFYMAHCINEMVCRYKLNIDKRKDILLLRSALSQDGKLDGNILSAGQAASQATLIHLQDFQAALTTKFGDYEAQRIAGFFAMNNTH